MAKCSVEREDNGPRYPKRQRSCNAVQEDMEEEEGQEDERRASVVKGSNCGKEGPDIGDQPNGDGSGSGIQMDLDVLDCSICTEPLSLPVFQCKNGHVACKTCCTNIKKICPSCCCRIGYNRCRAIEKVIESVRVSCRNTKYGCKEIPNYSKKHEHEKTCIYAPWSCPLTGCNFLGSSGQLSLHLSSKHPNCVKHFHYDSSFPIVLKRSDTVLVLQGDNEDNEGVLFIINHRIELLGHVVTIGSLGPNPSKGGFSYELIARDGDSSLSFQSSTEYSPGWVDNPPSMKFLIVPSGFLGSSQQLKLDLCIWSKD